MEIKLVVSPTARPATVDDICKAFFGKNTKELVKEIQLKGVDGVKERIAGGCNSKEYTQG